MSVTLPYTDTDILKKVMQLTLDAVELYVGEKHKYPVEQTVDSVLHQFLSKFQITVPDSTLQAWRMKLIAYGNSVAYSPPVAHPTTPRPHVIVEGSLVKTNGNSVSPAAPLPSQNGKQNQTTGLVPAKPAKIAKPVPVHSQTVVLGKNVKTGKYVTISNKARQGGLHVLGRTGAGKSTLNNGILLGDIDNGHGGILVDVDGDNIDYILPRIPEDRMQDVILLDLTELGKMRRYIGINPLSALQDTTTDPDVVIDRYMHVFKLLWNIGKETPRLENTLRASLLTLAMNGLTIAEMPSLLGNKEFRKRCIEVIPKTLENEGLLKFWQLNFDALYVQEQLKYADSTLNKVLQFLMVRKVLYAISQNTTTIPFRDLIDARKIILLKLNPNELGETATQFLGTFLMAELKNALFSRSDKSLSERDFFSCIFDEWQLYVTSDFKDLLSRGRKYGVAIVVANQTLEQLQTRDTELVSLAQQANIHVTFGGDAKDANARAPYISRDPQPELREQEDKLPASNPFDRLVNGHPIKSPIVQKFVDDHLRKIDADLKLDPRVRADLRHTLNSFIHQAITNNPLDVLCSSVKFLVLLNEYYQFAPYYFRHALVPFEIKVEHYTQLVPYTYQMQRGRYFSGATGYRQVEVSSLTCPLWIRLYNNEPLDEEMVQALASFLQTGDTTFVTLAEKRLKELVLSYLEAYYSRYSAGSYPPNHEETEKMAKELQLWLTEEREHCEEFLTEFRDFLLALAADPPLEHTGQYTMVEAGQRTYADMQNQASHEIVGLTAGRAYVANRSLGDRDRPLIKVDIADLNDRFKKEGELEKRRKQALDNALQYTTEAHTVAIDVLKRRQRFGIGLSAAEQQTEQEPSITSPSAQAHDITDTAHAIVCISQETTPDTYLELLYYFSNLTLRQALKLVGLVEQTSISKREQSKINRLLAEGLAGTVEPGATTFLSTGGRAPLVYLLKKKGYDKLQREKGLKPINHGDFSPHAYKVNEVLCAVVQGIKEPSYTLVDFTHEKQFRQQKPIKLGNKELEPDGWLYFLINGKHHSVFLEVDLRSEGSGKLKEKIRHYCQAIETKAHTGFRAEKISIAFINPQGKEADTDRLQRIIQEALEETGMKKYASCFLVASVSLEDITPVDLLTAAIYKQPFDTTSSPLIQ